MAINVADNFSYKGSKPLDARIKANTVSALVSTPAADLYDGCFAYVTETKKYYSYDSTNTSDPTLGKWREFQQGGGGGGSLPAGGTTGQSLVKHSDSDNDAEWFDVNKEISFDDFNELTQEEKDNGTSYYIPDATVVSNLTVMGNRFDKANIYTADERMIGSWMGKPLYQKVWLELNVQPIYNSWVNIIDYANVESLIKASYGNLDNNYPNLFSSGIGAEIRYNEGYFQIKYCQSNTIRQLNYFIVQYTKTTDTTVNIGTGNDYSTDEQIIGTWIDGKPLYQKTYDVGTDASITYSLPSYINKVINFSGIIEGFAPIPYVSSSTNFCIYLFVDKDNNINIRKGSSIQSIASGTAYVTIQYTKTTD